MHSSAAMTFQTIPSSRQLKMLRQDKAISEFQTVKQNTSAVPKKIREASYVYWIPTLQLPTSTTIREQKAAIHGQ